MRDPRRLADFDEADVHDDVLVVRGAVPAGCAVRLAVRRYKSPPAWAGVEVMAVDASGAAGDDQRFELSCSLGGYWGLEGVEVVGDSVTARFPRA